MASNVANGARLLAAMILVAACVRSAPAQSVPILSVTFDGNKAFDTAALKAQMRINRDGGWYSPEGLQLELKTLGDFLQNAGFLRARVGPPQVEMRAVPNKGQAAVIRIPIVEGTRYVLGDLHVRNAVAFKTATLLQMSPLRAGQPYSRARLYEWREKIEEAYHTMGYIRVELDAKEEIHDLKGVVDCVLECKEGNAYRIGKILVSGDDSISRPDFKKLLLVGEGSLYNPEMVSLSLQFLNTLRTYRPLTDSDVEIKIDDAKSTVDLTFKVVSLAARRPSS
jgi:outer membrane protein insertion porin family